MRRKFIKAHNVGFLSEASGWGLWGWGKLEREFSATMGTIDYEDGVYIANVRMQVQGVTIIAKIYFNYEPEQRGGRTDPSWKEHLEYSHVEIVSAKTFVDESEYEDAQEVKNDAIEEFEKIVDLYSDEITSEVEKRLSER